MDSHPKAIAENAVKLALQSLGIINEVQSTLEPTDLARGDFASSVALQIAKDNATSPHDLALRITEQLSSQPEIDQAEVAGPGFINLRLRNDIWREWFANDALAELEVRPKQNKTVNLEFVSANPTGPLVLVNAWQAYYGDILARIYEQQGYKVSREYYSNNTGTQIEQLGRSVQAACGAEFNTEATAQLYRGDYIGDLAEQISHDYGSRELVCSQDPYAIGQKASEFLFESIKHSVAKLGVTYDRYFSEAEVDLDQTRRLLEEKNALLERDGAVWLKKSVAGSEEDRVLIRSENKGPTYLYKDIAYQLDRLKKRAFTIAITIIGADHHAETQYLANTLRFLGYEGFIGLTTQTIRLVKDGKEIRMSKRAGNYVLLDEFLTRIPSDVARFFFAGRDITSHIDIDLDKLVEQSKSNPVFYTMYAYVRAKAILKKAAERNIQPGKLTHTISDYEQNILGAIAQLTPLLGVILKTYKVSSLLFLLHDIARFFHAYYEQNTILDIEDEQLRASKLAFVAQFARIMERAYELLGITPQESM